MSTVYVVIQGTYSDKEVVGVYDDLPLAEHVLRLIGGKHARIEGYTLNEHADALRRGVLLWYVHFERDGTPTVSQRHGLLREPHAEYGPDVPGWNHERRIHAYVAASDEAQALKIAQDLRAELLAKTHGLSE